MSLFQPTAEERDTLKKAVAKFAHEPGKSLLLARLDDDHAEFNHGSDEWTHLKYCVEKHQLHMQTEVRRDPKTKSVKAQATIADALAAKFNPNFSH